MKIDNLIREELLNIKPYLPGKPIEEVKRELGLDKVIKLASNENPLGPAPKAVKAIKKAAKKANIYPDGNAYQLKRMLSTKLGLSEENLLFGNGSDEILVMLAQSFLTSEDEIVVAKTTFSEYEFAANIMGAKVKKVPLKSYQHDLKAMAEAVTEKTKLVFICNPNNPTGTIISKKEIEQFLETVGDDVLVVLDEAYQEYATSKDYPDSINYLTEQNNIIILRTFSKAYGIPGVRIGYAVATPEVISYLERVRQPFNVNAIAQKAAVAALEDRGHLRDSLANNLQQKEYLYQELSRLGLDYVPTQANFILVEVGRDADEVFKALLKEGIIIRSMKSYNYDTKIRVTIGLPKENKLFIKKLEKVLSNL